MRARRSPRPLFSSVRYPPESISKENGFQQFNAPLKAVNETVRILGLEIADLKALIEYKQVTWGNHSPLIIFFKVYFVECDHDGLAGPYVSVLVTLAEFQFEI